MAPVTGRQLTDGSAVPADGSHTRLRPDGQQQGYVVLTPEERAKGFVKPVRDTYLHTRCGSTTKMGRSIAETYAREPKFYSGTFCCRCGTHFPLTEFAWEPDGEPMHVPLQAAWHEEQAALRRAARQRRILDLREEIARLEAEEAA